MEDPEKIHQAPLLEKLQDEISYIVECLLQDYTGEVKREISALIRLVDSIEGLDRVYRAGLSSALDLALQELGADNQSTAARGKIITLRRRVRNTCLVLLGKETYYNYAEPLDGEGS